MDKGLMNITFGEPVNASSFVASSISFQAAENLGTSPSAETISLSSTNVTVLSPDGLTQVIDLGLNNLNNIKVSEEGEERTRKS